MCIFLIKCKNIVVITMESVSVLGRFGRAAVWFGAVTVGVHWSTDIPSTTREQQTVASDDTRL